MSNAALSGSSTQTPRRRTSWLGGVGLRLLGRWGARIGLVWIGLVALLAIFAPFLASSHPLWWKTAGRVSSPLLASLTGADVLFLTAFAMAAVWPLLRRLAKPVQWTAMALVLAAGSGLALWVHPSETPSFTYRQTLAADPSIEAVFAPVPYSPSDHQDDVAGELRFQQPPDARHWLGTDLYGGDVLSHMIHACRIAMLIGLMATGISLAIGVVVGGLMGYYAGWFDLIGMRLVDIFSAIPTLSILIMICAFYGRNIYLMMFVIGLFGWVGYAVFIRAEFLRLRNADFVQAAQAVGASTGRILLRHLLPNGITPVLTLASFGVASAILIESGLSFLGLGLPPGEPSWGQLLEMARSGGGLQWWLVVFPGIAIFLTVFAYNLIGEALRDALDPKLNK